MTGKEIAAKIPKKCRRGHDNDPVTVCRGCLHAAIDAAIAAERERCVKIVRDSEGKFVSLSSCEALVDEIQREGT